MVERWFWRVHGGSRESLDRGLESRRISNVSSALDTIKVCVCVCACVPPYACMFTLMGSRRFAAPELSRYDADKVEKMGESSRGV